MSMANNPDELQREDKDPLAEATDTPDLGDDFNIDDTPADPPAAAAGAPAAGDDAGAGEGEGDDGQGNGSKFVPHSRFHEVNERAKAAERAAQEEREARIRLEERLRALEGGAPATERQPEQPAAPAFDLKAKIKERNAAILEGDDDRVAEIELEIEQHRIADAEARAVARIQQEQRADALQQAAAAAIEAYPFLDSNSETCDRQALQDVKEWRDFYINKGMQPHEALNAAVNRMKPELDAKLGGSSAPAPAAKTPAQIAAEKKAASAMRNAEAAGKQPPPPGGMSNGITPTTPDVMNMTSEEWAKLPEKEREKLLA